MTSAGCVVCGVATDVEAVLMPAPATIERLAVMYRAHHRELGAWPSAWLCDEHEAASAPVFDVLARLPDELLEQITSDHLAAVVRSSTERQTTCSE